MPFDDDPGDDDDEDGDDECEVEALPWAHDAAMKLDRKELISSTLDLSAMGRRTTADPSVFNTFLLCKRKSSV